MPAGVVRPCVNVAERKNSVEVCRLLAVPVRKRDSLASVSGLIGSPPPDTEPEVSSCSRGRMCGWRRGSKPSDQRKHTRVQVHTQMHIDRNIHMSAGRWQHQSFRLSTCMTCAPACCGCNVCWQISNLGEVCCGCLDESNAGASSGARVCHHHRKANDRCRLQFSVCDRHTHTQTDRGVQKTCVCVCGWAAQAASAMLTDRVSALVLVYMKLCLLAAP